MEKEMRRERCRGIRVDSAEFSIQHSASAICFVVALLKRLDILKEILQQIGYMPNCRATNVLNHPWHAFPTTDSTSIPEVRALFVNSTPLQPGC